MTHSKLHVTAVLLFTALLNNSQAQIQKGELVKGKTYSAEMPPGEKHQYTAKLEKDQFALFKLMQKGVDVFINTYDLKHNKLDEFDSPNGKQGPEFITLASTDKGTYTLEIAPFDEKEPLGNYELQVMSIKPRASTPAGKIDELFVMWDDVESPGGSVAVVKDGAIVYKKGYGSANLEYGIPNSPSTVFHIASVSKQFTVFSILLLEKDGKLSLDDDIRKYIPEVPDFGKTITLRHLASHTSGLRDQWDLLVMAGWRMDDVITTEHVLKLISKQKELNFDPGEKFTYCNTGFTLLAEVVTRVSGKSFAAFTEERIFKPLQMKQTLFYDDHEKIVKNRAYSYYANAATYKKSNLNYANVGATSLFTTAEDLSLWAMNFSTAKVGDTSIFRKMNTPAVLNNGKTFTGALGQFVDKYKGLEEIQHSGADAGYRSFLARFPNERFSVIVLSNAAEFNPYAVAHKIADIYLSDKYKPEPPKEEKKPETPEAAHTKTFDPAAVVLSDFTGCFFSEELSTEYHFKNEGGQLVAKHSRASDLVCQPTRKDVFNSPLGETEFVRDANNVIIGCKVSSGRSKKVWFKKTS